MPQTYTVDVNEVCRVEGHGNIHVGVRNGDVEYVKMGIHEGARLFEALLVGRHYSEVPKIVCRICAICSSHHNITSNMAIENALGGVTNTPQTRLLRELLFLGGQIESHYLHVYFLALPDFLGYTGAPAMAADYGNEVKLALSMKKLGNDIQAAIGGREIHPVATEVGGFTAVPSAQTLQNLRARLVKAMDGAMFTAELFSKLDYPDYYTDTDYDFLTVEPDGGQFGFMGTQIVDAGGNRSPVAEYQKYINEFVVGHSTAKQSTYREKTFFVGSLARTNLLGERLTGKSREALQMLGLDKRSVNPIHNNPAQVVEGVYCIERAIEIIDLLLEKGPVVEPLAPYTVQAGFGAAATEVPRGTLYHSYSIDENGIVTEADVITPTAQNLANIEFHMRQVVRRSGKTNAEDLSFELEKLVRAYDPCISCSAHAVILD